MDSKTIIAVDAMGGEGSPKKIIDGIKLSLEDSKENFFQIYGDKNLINSLINDKDEINEYSEIFHCDGKVADDDTPLSAAKK